MALTKQFSNKLDDLWKRRTAPLRSLVIKKRPGQPPKFSRRIRDRLINQLLDSATQLLLNRDGRQEFRAITKSRHLWQIKGHGTLKRGANLTSWAEDKLSGPIVYVFWRRRTCLYVGKGKSPRRLRSYTKSVYLREGTCIEVFHVTSKSHLAKAECLATHLFGPRDQQYKPAKAKWGKACPICRKHDAIRDELRTLFKMK